MDRPSLSRSGETAGGMDAASATATFSQRLAQLEETVETLRREVEALKGSAR